MITRIEYAPRKGYATRMVGGQFQGALAGDPNFTSPVTLYTVPTAPTDGFITAQNGVLTSATINNATAFRYLRYIGPASGSCNVSEVVFHGNATGLTAPAAPVNVTASVPWYGGEADLSWTASVGATSYTIKRATNSGGPYMVLENVSGFKELTAISPITNYADYSVTAGASVLLCHHRAQQRGRNELQSDQCRHSGCRPNRDPRQQSSRVELDGFERSDELQRQARDCQRRALHDHCQSHGHKLHRHNGG